MAEMLSPLQIKRLYSGSLDADYTFETLEEMQEYVASPTSYAGQILYSVEDDKLYKINADVNGVDEVGGSEGGFIEVESSADLPNPPENKIFYTQPKPEEIPDFSSLWVQSGSLYKMQFFLDDIKTDVKFVFDDDSFIDWGLPLKDGWELSGSQYKYNYNGKTTPQAYPAAIIQTVSWFKEDGSTVQKTAMTLWMNTPRTFTLISDLQLYYMLPIDQGNKITVSPLLSQYRDMYNEMHPLDSSWTVHKVKYDMTTRVLTNQTSYSHAAQFIIEMPEPAILPLSQVWARDVELATKEYVDGISGLPAPEDKNRLLYSFADENGGFYWRQVTVEILGEDITIYDIEDLINNPPSTVSITDQDIIDLFDKI